MAKKDRLEEERKEILREMDGIRRMRRGTVNEQVFESRRRDGSVTTRGPYYLYSRTEKGKSFSQRISAEEAVRYQEETENCRRFKELANRCVVVCEQLTVEDVRSREKKRSRTRLRKKSVKKSKR